MSVSAVQTRTFFGSGQNNYVLSLVCTLNTTGTVVTSYPIDGYVMSVQTVPDGGTPPTSGYGLTLIDANGQDIMGGALASRSSTAAQTEYPLVGTSATPGPILVPGTLTLTFSSNSVANGITTVNIEVQR